MNNDKAGVIDFASFGVEAEGRPHVSWWNMLL